MTWQTITVIALLLLVVIATVLRRSGASAALPYRLKSALFTPAERSFLGVLEQAIGKHELCGTVGLPLVRIPAKRAYAVQELRTIVLDATQQRLEPSLTADAAI